MSATNGTGGTRQPRGHAGFYNSVKPGRALTLAEMKLARHAVELVSSQLGEITGYLPLDNGRGGIVNALALDHEGEERKIREHIGINIGDRKDTTELTHEEVVRSAGITLGLDERFVDELVATGLSVEQARDAMGREFARMRGIDIPTTADAPSPLTDIDLLPDLETFTPPKFAWMIDGLLVDGTLNVIYGKPGHGKSYLADGLVGSVTTGTQFCGRAVAQAPGLIIERDGQTLGLFQRRFRQLGLKTGPNLKVWGNWIPEDAPFPSSPAVVAWVRKHGRCLVVLDSQIAFMAAGKKENESADMRPFYDSCRVLTRLGATVVSLHHPTKDGEDPRGSGDIGAAPDGIYQVKKTSPGLKLETLKLIIRKIRTSTYEDGTVIDSELNFRLRDNGKGWAMDATKDAVAKDQYGGAPLEFRLTELLDPINGITQSRFAQLAVEKKWCGRDAAIRFLKEGVQDGDIKQEVGRRNSRLYFRFDPLWHKVPK